MPRSGQSSDEFLCCERVTQVRRRYCPFCKNHGLVVFKADHICSNISCDCDNCKCIRQKNAKQKLKMKRWLQNKQLDDTLMGHPDAAPLPPMEPAEAGQKCDNEVLADMMISGRSHRLCPNCKIHGENVPKKKHTCPHMTCGCKGCRDIRQRNMLQKYKMRRVIQARRQKTYCDTTGFYQSTFSLSNDNSVSGTDDSFVDQAEAGSTLIPCCSEMGNTSVAEAFRHDLHSPASDRSRNNHSTPLSSSSSWGQHDNQSIINNNQYSTNSQLINQQNNWLSNPEVIILDDGEVAERANHQYTSQPRSDPRSSSESDGAYAPPGTYVPYMSESKTSKFVISPTTDSSLRSHQGGKQQLGNRSSSLLVETADDYGSGDPRGGKWGDNGNSQGYYHYHHHQSAFRPAVPGGNYHHGYNNNAESGINQIRPNSSPNTANFTLSSSLSPSTAISPTFSSPTSVNHHHHHGNHPNQRHNNAIATLPPPLPPAAGGFATSVIFKNNCSSSPTAPVLEVARGDPTAFRPPRESRAAAAGFDLAATALVASFLDRQSAKYALPHGSIGKPEINDDCPLGIGPNEGSTGETIVGGSAHGAPSVLGPLMGLAPDNTDNSSNNGLMQQSGDFEPRPPPPDATSLVSEAQLLLVAPSSAANEVLGANSSTGAVRGQGVAAVDLILDGCQPVGGEASEPSEGHQDPVMQNLKVQESMIPNVSDAVAVIKSFRSDSSHGQDTDVTKWFPCMICMEMRSLIAQSACQLCTSRGLVKQCPGCDRVRCQVLQQLCTLCLNTLVLAGEDVKRKF